VGRVRNRFEKKYILLFHMVSADGGVAQPELCVVKQRGWLQKQ